MLQLDMRIIYTLINMLVLYGIFRIFLLKPLNRVLEQRKAMVQDSLNQAKNSADKAAGLEQQYQETLQNAKQEAEEIIRQAKKQGEAAQRQMMAEARGEIDRQKKQMQEQMHREREQLMKNTREEIAMIAMLAASKILEREINEKQDHDMLIEKLIREAGVKQ